MSTFDEIFDKKIIEAVSAVFNNLSKSFDLFPDLPLIATTTETSAALRVSDDVLRRMAEDGMPHIHAGRELRFGKALIVEWMSSGKIYTYEICAGKRHKVVESIKLETQVEPEAKTVFSVKTSQKLAEFVITNTRK